LVSEAAGSSDRANNIAEGGCLSLRGIIMVRAAWSSGYKADIVDLHDMFMIIYLLLNLPWMYLSSINASTSQARRRRQVKRVNPS